MSAHSHDLPPEAYAAALTALPAMGPARLAALFDTWPAEEAWTRVSEGRAHGAPAVSAASRPNPPAVAAAWRRAAEAMHVAGRWEELLKAGIGVAIRGSAGYPAALADDHEAPAVVFWLGDLGALDGRRVAIVGSRRCSRYGRDVAAEMGRDLAAAGVRVVSGLALGVDGAAHTGVLAAASAPPVAVVGSGFDVFYPPAHRRLWAEVARAGVVISEAPLGAAPEPWRFPVRNRIIAALAELVVVVESRHTGGSRHTVEAAVARGRPVFAVPGPVRSVTSQLPNALLAEGCAPARDALDVLVALDLSAPPTSKRPADHRPTPNALAGEVLESVGWGEPATFEELVLDTGHTPSEVSVALAHLERDGWVVGGAGRWERR